MNIKNIIIYVINIINFIIINIINKIINKFEKNIIIHIKKYYFLYYKFLEYFYKNKKWTHAYHKHSTSKDYNRSITRTIVASITSME